MTEAICQSWFEEIFLKECGPERPQLLICDSHNSHEALNLIETAKANDIHILALPPRTTHTVQPLDKSVFGPLNSFFNEACTEYLSSHPINTISKWSFPRLIPRALERSMTSRNIISGFASCGIYPYSCSPLRNEEMMPSRVFDRPLPVPNATSTSGTAMEAAKNARQHRIRNYHLRLHQNLTALSDNQQMSQIVQSC